MTRWSNTVNALRMGAAICLFACLPAQAGTTLINASSNINQEMFQEYNAAFTRYWRGKTGEAVTIKQTHAQSTNQVARIRNGEEADVVTLAVSLDIDKIAASGLLPADWQGRLSNHSSPFTSTVVFLVRRGNPRQIKDWDDLVRWGINVVTSNPKSSGIARWGHLAAYGYALKQPGGNDASAKLFLKRLYGNNRVLEYTARGANTAFTKGKIGDAMITWESEAMQIVAAAPDEYEIVVPSMSIVAEPPVAMIDKMVDKRGTRKLADAYLNYLYSAEAQELLVKYNYRPSDRALAEKYANRFKPLTLFRVDQVFGSWGQAFKDHFTDGGVLDQVYDPFRNAS
ncbi:sulfate ABC transporter substrate-binding protein [Niveibacterium sp. 24ML]|uniref:sulfate ABC transporter substrate-binding protein n=1 Tax=Niveibacterium sp. 24ML TaxID=2985512 RepID=UPI00227172F1|nr:sulfate ABC transporter substrate-binding protein [Niveibacterium sp. 24ML]MCX9157259.1 sulfate ABC transporter substrate-binding protein [Niveibacterium sp. 24ML]